ncbi:MAG: hypothetical protein M1282_15940 [Chloroflexi bacterium]|nr:hypothetical protein [Chloroflexota bacterium]
MKRIRALLFVIMMFSLVGCNLPQTQLSEGAAGPSTPTAWLDAPLDGSTIPLAPYEVIFHIADAAGVALGEVSVNGQVISSLPNPNGTETPATLRSMWTPTSPGLYTIQVRAQGSSGNWSGYASAQVTVGELTETVSPTPVITFTPTPVITFTPTPTPTATITVTPVPVQQSIFTGLPVFNPEQVDLGRGCPATSLTAEIKVTSTQSINVVVLFFRVTDNGFAEHTEWADIGMHAAGSNTYRVTFNPFQAGDFASWLTAHWSAGWEGWLTTQFVIQQKDGSYTRSDVYSQVKIAGCN